MRVDKVWAYASASLICARGKAADLRSLASPHDLEEAECLEKAEAATLQAPDKHDWHPTTSRLLKRDLAAEFCGRSPKHLTALEIGIFKGHTTAVLSAVFGRVLAVDVEIEYLQLSAERNRNQTNIVFLPFDSFADDWQLLRSNKIDVVFIDGNHHYEKVRNDAVSSLSYLSPVAHLIFDDYGIEAEVRRAVTELEEANALVDCKPLGHGKDGQPWVLKDLGLVNHSEAILCSRGSTMTPGREWARIDFPYFLHTVPADPLMRAEGVVRFTASKNQEPGRQDRGTIWTTRWGTGVFQREWSTDDQGRLRDAFNVTLPGLGSGRWEALFNRGRTAFILSRADSIEASWFGIRLQTVNHVFTMANNQFNTQDIGHE
mmetsp:Transcript_118523/g.221442  ORF Transcript_118523/g.221442 Transcript_118523/m.221442 type:complete len:374 (+) Transcript_118523:129-1250(+)